MKRFLTPFDVCYCQFCGVIPTLLQFLIHCYLWFIRSKWLLLLLESAKKDTRRGECAFKLVKGSMKSFELNKGNILPEKTKKKSRSLWPLSVLAVFTDILLHA